MVHQPPDLLRVRGLAAVAGGVMSTALSGAAHHGTDESSAFANIAAARFTAPSRSATP